MILMEFDGFDYADVEKAMKERRKKSKSKSIHEKKNKKKPTKQKKSGFTKLVNKTAGVKSFTEGEIAVIKSRVVNDVKTSLNNQKGKQKTIGAKKDINFHRKMK